MNNIKYIKIEHLRNNDIELFDGNIAYKNDQAFDIGDELVIQEKIDGSNASFHYLGNNKFIACSRRKILNDEINLFGFYQYCKKLSSLLYKIEQKIRKKFSNNFDYLFDYCDFIFYGEWTGHKNLVVYDDKFLNDWFIFDIYSLKDHNWLPFDIVKIIVYELNMEFDSNFSLKLVPQLAVINDFKGWETIKPFANVNYSNFGETQEGIVIKNNTKLNFLNDYPECEQNDYPLYVKIVNKQFLEVKYTKKIKPNKNDLIKNAYSIMEGVVTPARVKKIITKSIEDGEVNTVLNKSDLEQLLKIIPEKIFEDIKIEEPELVKSAGKYARSQCYKISVKIIKLLVLK